MIVVRPETYQKVLEKMAATDAVQVHKRQFTQAKKEDVTGRGRRWAAPLAAVGGAAGGLAGDYLGRALALGLVQGRHLP